MVGRQGTDAAERLRSRGVLYTKTSQYSEPLQEDKRALRRGGEVPTGSCRQGAGKRLSKAGGSRAFWGLKGQIQAIDKLLLAPATAAPAFPPSSRNKVATTYSFHSLAVSRMRRVTRDHSRRDHGVCQMLLVVVLVKDATADSSVVLL